MKKILAVICALILCLSCAFAEEDESFEGRNALQYAASFQGHFNKFLSETGEKERFEDTFDTFMAPFGDYIGLENDGCYPCIVPGGYIRISKESGAIKYAHTTIACYKDDKSTLEKIDMYKSLAMIASLEYEYRYTERQAIGALLEGEHIDNIYEKTVEIFNSVLTIENALKFKDLGPDTEIYGASYAYNYYLTYTTTELNGSTYENFILTIKAPDYEYSPLIGGK